MPHTIQIKQRFERQLLLNFLIITISNILFYCTYDLASGQYDSAMEWLGVMAIYFIFYWLVRVSNSFAIIKRACGALFLTAVALSFFMLGGLRGMAPLDFAGALVILASVFVGRERSVMLLLVSCMFVSFVFIDVNCPDVVKNVRADDPLVLQFIGVGFRLLALLYGIYLNKNEFERERGEVYKVNESLRLAEKENARNARYIETYTDQLKRMVENLRREKQQVTKANLQLEDANLEIKTQGQKIQEYNHKLRKLIGDLEREKALAESLNLQLKDANEDVVRKNHLIELANQNLEKKVAERTSSIASLNKKLIEYSFHNSHRVRGPLARILGLLNLMNIFFERHDTRNGEEKMYFEMLNKSAEELDASIHDITIFLNEVIKEEVDAN